MKQVLKKLLITMIVMILLLMASSQAATYAYNIYVKEHRFNGNVYKYNDHTIYDYALDNNSVNDYYCLKGGTGVASSGTGGKYGIYNGKLTDFMSATSVPNELSGVFRSDNDLSEVQNLKAVQWLVRNMYVTSSEKTVAEKDIMHTHLNELIVKYAPAYKDCNAYSVDDEFISAIQQFVVWQFVKPAKNASYYQGSIVDPSSIGKISFNGSIYGDEGQKIGFAIYTALLQGATKYAKGESGVIDMPQNGDSYKLTLTTNDSDVKQVEGKANTYIVGPIVLETQASSLTNIEDSFSISITDKKYTDANGNPLSTQDLKVLARGETYYITFTTKEDMSKNLNIKYNVSGNYVARLKSVTGNVYYEGNKQPILEINKIFTTGGDSKSLTFKYQVSNEFDLALTKQIAQVYRYDSIKKQYLRVYDSENTESSDTNDDKSDDIYYEKRLNEINTKTIKTNGDAQYYMDKEAVTVLPGDIVRYKISIYNEGNVDGYFGEVIDYLPTGMELLISNENTNYGSYNYTYSNLLGALDYNTYNKTDNIVKFKFDSDNYGEKLDKYNSEDENLSGKVIYFEAKVTNDVKADDILTNVAEISKYGYVDANGKYQEADKEGVDIDSEENNVFTRGKNNVTSKETYYQYIEAMKNTIENLDINISNIDKNFISLQDDDDFEQVKIGKFDVALRKNINSVNGQSTSSDRVPEININSALRLRATGTANYYHTKAPIKVKLGDTVVYTISIYNEGNKAGYAKEITDYLPAGLEFKEDSQINKDNGWVATENSDGTTKITTTKLEDTEISASNGARGYLVYYSRKAAGIKETPKFMKTVQVECTVTSVGNNNGILTNVAEISKYGYNLFNTDDSGKLIEGNSVTYVAADQEKIDIDSEQDNVITKLQEQGKEASTTGYYEYQSERHDVLSIYENNYQGLQDDDDFENVEVEPFDLALRKFITKVNGNDIETNRTPKIEQDSIDAYSNSGTAIYYHEKTPVKVESGDTVTYTIRVYNEGYKEGYAKEITDYLPSGLEYKEDSQINKDNGWVATKNSDGTTTIKTNKIASEVINPAQGTDGFTKLYNAEKNNTELTGKDIFWKDVQIECKVNSVIDGKVLTNVSEITNYGYNDSDGTYVEANKKGVDRDSEENNVFNNDSNKITQKIKNIENYYSYQNINDPEKEYFKGIQDDDDFENVIVSSIIPYEFILNKVDENDEPINGANFTIIKDNETPITETINGTKTIKENAVVNKTYKYTVKENNSASGYLNLLGENNIKISAYMNENLELVLGEYRSGTIVINTVEDNYYAKYGYYLVDKDGKLLEDTKTDLYNKVKVFADNNTSVPSINVKINNKKINGSYNMEILKIDENNEPIQGVSFKVKEGTNQEKTYGPTKADGKVTIVNNKNITAVGVDKYTITEVVLNNNPYISVKDDIDVYVTKEISNEKYIASKVSFEQGKEVKSKQVTLQNGTKTTVTASVANGTVTISIPNKEIEGKYDVELIKVDQKDSKTPLSGVTFDVTVKKDNKEITLYDTDGKEIKTKGLVTDDSGEINLSNIKITEEGLYTYEIIETDVPEGYTKIKDPIYLTVKTGVDNYKYVVVDSKISGDAELNTNNNKITVKVKNGQFDLALRKFITGVTTNVGNENEAKTEVTTRIPVFKVDEQGKYVYEHTKEPVLVANQNVVEYTIRVYNEGSIAGYAKEIKDDIPDGLEFLPDDELNKEYRWLMLDEEGNETDDVTKAKYITSDYLSKEQEKTEGENLLKAFDKEAYDAGKITEPDYREVKVAFKVTMPNTSDEIIINQAQISDDSDEDGNEVTDKDSTPNEWIEGEDDQDIEKIKVQYFDLALRKWVTKAIVTENGKETVTETGHKAEDDPEEVVKVDLKKSKIKDVVVKFEYQIRVTNEGQIAGSVEEISDYIPEGLKFVAADNPLWKEVDGKVVTDQLAGQIMQPGESKEVTILLTWINREDNMGLKINVAEISKDYNEYGSPDIDSTPNNKVPGEDDIDDAPVMLTVTTGEKVMYLGIYIAVLAVIAVGIYGVKKYIIK